MTAVPGAISLLVSGRRRVLEEFPRDGGAVSRRAIHELFEEQVERTPQAIAVTAGRSTEYGELIAGRTSWRTICWVGVQRGPGVICMERSRR